MEIAPTITTHDIELFATPIIKFKHHWQNDAHQQLLEDIFALERASEGVQKTNIGGWHSDVNIHQLNIPSIDQMVETFKSVITLWSENFFVLEKPLDPSLWNMEVWANINRAGHANRPHDHFRRNLFVSGFFCVSSGDLDSGGETVFINQQAKPLIVETPVPIRQATHPVTPIDGIGYVFPSWLGHEVKPTRSQTPRISLAFDASHPAIPVKKRGDNPRFKTIRKHLHKRFRPI